LYTFKKFRDRNTTTIKNGCVFLGGNNWKQTNSWKQLETNKKNAGNNWKQKNSWKQLETNKMKVQLNKTSQY